PRMIGAAPSGYWLGGPLPSNQPAKLNGQNTVPGATRSVTCVFNLICALDGVCTQTYSSFFTPRSLASFGLFSTKISSCSSGAQGFDRVSSPPPSYSTSRPLVSTSG